MGSEEIKEPVLGYVLLFYECETPKMKTVLSSM
jgi:hypothetical protein